MAPTLHLIIAASLSIGGVIAGPVSGAHAAAHDGNWSVLVVTERGHCDRGYRYSVSVTNGQVSYNGNAVVNISGTVAANGAVKVSINGHGQGANGTGRLSAGTGAGVWRGSGPSGDCSGRWEAERR